MTASWKNVERNIAELLGGVRIPVTGRRGEDIKSDIFYPDVKSRLTVPKTYFYNMEAAEAAQHNMIKLLHQSVYYCLWRVGDTKNFLNRSLTPCPIYLLDIRWPQTGFTWLEHIKETSPDNKVPCVILHRPYVKYKDALVLCEWKDSHDLFYSRS